MRSSDLVRPVNRVLFILTFLVIASSVASAYTIVMLGGRHIQIPDQFTVTKTTLTYDVGRSLSATLLLAAIDVSATERANHEAPGSLLKRAEGKIHSPEEFSPAAQRGKSPEQRTITNSELLPYAEKRRASELAYEKRRTELGLPSPEESRRRAAADEESLAQIADAELGREQQSEEYWRTKASALRDDLASVDGQITFLQARLGELPDSPVIGSLLIGNGAFSALGQSRISPSFNPNFGPRRSVFVAPSVRGRFGSPGASGRDSALINPIAPRPGFRALRRPWFGVPVAPVFGSLWPSYDYGDDVSALRLELDRMLTMQAGLEASQRELEDEARRAGAPPGWLRP